MATSIAILGVRLIHEGNVLYQLSMQYWGCDLYTSATYTRVSTVHEFTSNFMGLVYNGTTLNIEDEHFYLW